MSMLVSDYDGTYANSENNIILNSVAVEKFIQDGNIFVLSSGRSYESLIRKTETCNIPYSFLACADGNYLFDKDGNILLSNEIDHESVSKIDKLKEIGNYKRVDYTYEREYSTEYDKDKPLGSISFVINNCDITDEFRTEFERIKRENPRYDYSIYGYADEMYFMIKPKNVSKTSPIIFLEKKLNIPKSDIFTIGDGLNDLEMIRDYNGFVIGENPDLRKVALDNYNSVYELVSDIEKRKVKRR